MLTYTALATLSIAHGQVLQHETWSGLGAFRVTSTGQLSTAVQTCLFFQGVPSHLLPICQSSNLLAVHL